MAKVGFEWDERKDRENREKHGVSFALAQQAFLDPRRIVARDKAHSKDEERLYCIGKTGRGILTVRFTWRGDAIRIIGAGFWRKGRRLYGTENEARG